MSHKNKEFGQEKKLRLGDLELASFVTIAGYEKETLRGGSTGGCFPSVGPSAGNRCTGC